MGRLVIDMGAAGALARGKSLLPAGVRHIEGSFARGDAVSIVSEAGEEIARGLVAYDMGDARRIAGLKSSEIGKATTWARPVRPSGGAALRRSRSSHSMMCCS